MNNFVSRAALPGCLIAESEKHPALFDARNAVDAMNAQGRIYAHGGHLCARTSSKKKIEHHRTERYRLRPISSGPRRRMPGMN